MVHVNRLKEGYQKYLRDTNGDTTPFEEREARNHGSVPPTVASEENDFMGRLVLSEDEEEEFVNPQAV